jgi:hypothetical protein
MKLSLTAHIVGIPFRVALVSGDTECSGTVPRQPKTPTYVRCVSGRSIWRTTELGRSQPTRRSASMVVLPPDDTL